MNPTLNDILNPVPNDPIQSSAEQNVTRQNNVAVATASSGQDPDRTMRQYDEPNCMDRASKRCWCCFDCALATLTFVIPCGVYGACQCSVDEELFARNEEQHKRSQLTKVILVPGRWNSDSCVPWTQLLGSKCRLAHSPISLL